MCIKKGERTAENVKHKILTFRAKVLYLHEFFFHLKISELSKVFRFFSLIVFTFSDMTGAICLWKVKVQGSWQFWRIINVTRRMGGLLRSRISSHARSILLAVISPFRLTDISRKLIWMTMSTSRIIQITSIVVMIMMVMVMLGACSRQRPLTLCLVGWCASFYNDDDNNNGKKIIIITIIMIIMVIIIIVIINNKLTIIIIIIIITVK